LYLAIVTPKMNTDSLSVTIPIYNSVEILPVLLQRLDVVLPTLSARFEVILLDDGSPDDSWNVILRLSREYHWLRGVNLMRNYGQHNALLCGIRMAAYETIITMDDDRQHSPEEVPKHSLGRSSLLAR
jgi:glycosyltransferase involved in cell wall biosynthesis